MALVPEQRQVVEAVAEGKSIFLTGVAGSGKTYTVTAALEVLKSLHSREKVLVTAMTGIAASYLEGGTTFHSALGFPIGNWSREEIVANIRKNPALLSTLVNCKCLVIDEVSFITRSMLHILDFAMQEIRGIREPFGGMQLMLIGDLLQLTLDGKDASKNTIRDLPMWSGKDGSDYLEDPLWWGLTPFVLKHPHRQGDDKAFIDLLNRLRFSTDKLNKADFKMFREWETPKRWPENVSPVKLFGTNAEVDAVNEKALLAFEGERHDYVAVDNADPKLLDEETNLLRSFSSKKGQPVIFLKNNPQHGLVNGSQGCVVGFVSKRDAGDYPVIGSLGAVDEFQFPLVKFASPDKLVLVGLTTCDIATCSPAIESPGSRVQIPLRPAFALTVHRAQGMTIQYLYVDATNIQFDNQFYTAVSRATKSEWLEVRGLNCCNFPSGDQPQQFARFKKSIVRHVSHSFAAAALYRDRQTNTDAYNRKVDALKKHRPDLIKAFKEAANKRMRSSD